MKTKMDMKNKFIPAPALGEAGGGGGGVGGG